MRRVSNEMLAVMLESIARDAVTRDEFNTERAAAEKAHDRADAADRNLEAAAGRIAGLKQGIDAANRGAVTAGALLLARGAGNRLVGASERCSMRLTIRYGSSELVMHCSRTGLHSDHSYIGSFFPQTNPPPAGHLLTVTATEE